MIIVFDLWNTLGRKNLSYSTALRKHFNIKMDYGEYRLFEKSMMTQQWDDMESMALSFLQAFKIEANRRNISFVVKAEQMMLRLATPIPGMRRMLSKLSVKHKIGVLSNCTSFAEGLLEDWGMAEYITTPIFSFRTGKLKPHPEAFQEICEQHHVQANEVLFIDDNMQNCGAAEKFGMRAIQFYDIGQLENELRDLKLL